MLKGIDISNHQWDIDIGKLDIDFMICKATEGKTFIDKYCNGFVQKAIQKGIKWGIYHFARSNSAIEEAEFFYKNISGYIRKGIPILDYEVWDKNTNDIKWCEAFIEEFYELSGVWCMIYISASHCKDFIGSWIPEKCGLWVAGYPRDYTTWPDSTMPYKIAPWPFAAIWQFTHTLRLNGFSGNLDGNYAYMDTLAWDKYVNSNDGQAQNIDYNDLANQVIVGRWGNGQERADRLNMAYGIGTYDRVQAIVNSKLLATPDYNDLANQVIVGRWGNGWNRQQALDNAYGSGTYDKVQAIVNGRLS